MSNKRRHHLDREQEAKANRRHYKSWQAVLRESRTATQRRLKKDSKIKAWRKLRAKRVRELLQENPTMLTAEAIRLATQQIGPMP
jgi:hypothetical protein